MIAIFSFYSRNVQKNRNSFSRFVYFNQYQKKTPVEVCKFSSKNVIFIKKRKKKHRQKISADAENFISR